MAAPRHPWTISTALCAALVAVGSCVLPSYEVGEGAGGTGGSGLSGGGAAGGSGAAGGVGDTCVERPPACQPSTDGNCGECGRSCDDSAPCIGDRCPPRELAVADAWFMAYSNDLLYWTQGNPAFADGAVVRFDLDAGTPETVATSNAAPTGLSVDPSFVFWTEPDSGGSVYRAAHDGGGEESLFNGFSDAAVGVAASTEYVFFGIDGYFGAIQRGPYDGEDVGPPGLFVEDEVGYPMDLVVRGNDVYWTTFGASVSGTRAGVWRQGVHGGGVVELYATPGDQEYSELAIDDTHVYWASVTGVQRLPLSGPFPVSAPESISAAPATGVAVDSDAIYWIERESGLVAKRSKYCDGLGDPVVLFQGELATTGAGVSPTLAIGAGRVFLSSAAQVLSLPD